MHRERAGRRSARGEVVAVDAAAYFSRPGPRLIDGLELLAHILHPELFPSAEPAPGARRSSSWRRSAEVKPMPWGVSPVLAGDGDRADDAITAISDAAGEASAGHAPALAAAARTASRRARRRSGRRRGRRPRCWRR